MELVSPIAMRIPTRTVAEIIPYVRTGLAAREHQWTGRPFRALLLGALLLALWLTPGRAPPLLGDYGFAAWDDAQQAHAFTSPGGTEALRYSGIHARDSVGRELSTQLRQREDRLATLVNDRASVEPFTVDPFIQQSKVTPEGVLSEHFEIPFAISGDTVGVGAALGDEAGINAGAANMFVRNGATWGQQVILTASYNDGGDQFGGSIPVSGDTVVVAAKGKELPADLAISKTASPDPVVAGTTLTYSINVTNSGPNKATGVTIIDTLPPGVTLASASPGCSEHSGTVTCHINGNILSGASASVTIQVTVDPDTTGSISNVATVTSNDPDPDLSNNAASETTSIISVSPQADLTISKAGSPDPVVAGTALSYEIIVTNSGPSDATGVTVTDTLPPGVAFASASQGCSEVAGTLTCDVGSIGHRGVRQRYCPGHRRPRRYGLHHQLGLRHGQRDGPRYI